MKKVFVPSFIVRQVDYLSRKPFKCFPYLENLFFAPFHDDDLIEFTCQLEDCVLALIGESCVFHNLNSLYHFSHKYKKEHVSANDNKTLTLPSLGEICPTISPTTIENIIFDKNFIPIRPDGLFSFVSEHLVLNYEHQSNIVLSYLNPQSDFAYKISVPKSLLDPTNNINEKTFHNFFYLL